MQTWKRATVYFDPEIHRALRLKAAATKRSVSEIVSEAVELALGEGAEDLEALEQRRGEPVLRYLFTAAPAQPKRKGSGVGVGA